MSLIFSNLVVANIVITKIIAMHYYGYILHALCGISGVIHSYDMTAANVHDLHYLKDVAWEYHDCVLLGDKGYLGYCGRFSAYRYFSLYTLFIY